MSRLLLRINSLLQTLEQSLFGRGFPYGNYDFIHHRPVSAGKIDANSFELPNPKYCHLTILIYY